MERTNEWLLPEIDPERCNGCGVCVIHCPTQALALVGKLAFITWPENCIYSARCEEICPTGAINLPYYISYADMNMGRNDPGE